MPPATAPVGGENAGGLDDADTRAAVTPRASPYLPEAWRGQEFGTTAPVNDRKKWSIGEDGRVFEELSRGA